jgi:Acetyl-CoA carboxylase alpha subunit
MEWQPLDFEKPIFELERRLQDLKSHSTKHDVDLGSAVKELEAKLRETRRHVYDNLTAWQRVQIARHTQRPFALDYIQRCFTNWVELHGDRRFCRRSRNAMRNGDARPASVASLSLTKRGATPRRT